jgi:hypothetical protein
MAWRRYAMVALAWRRYAMVALPWRRLAIGSNLCADSAQQKPTTLVCRGRRDTAEARRKLKTCMADSKTFLRTPN